MKKTLQIIVFLAITAMVTGCATPYLVDRGRDAADIFTVSAGVGVGAKARVGPFCTGLVHHREAMGLRGGAFYWDLSLDEDIGDSHLLLLGHESFSPHRYPLDIWDERGKDYWTPYLILPIPIACPSSQNINSMAYLTQIEVVAGLGPSVRFGVNPGELLDFILGWTTIDIFNDDLERRQVAKERAPKDGVVKGKVLVERDSANNVISISIRCEDGQVVRVVLDEKGKELEQMDTRGVFVLGPYENHALKVRTWFMRQ